MIKQAIGVLVAMAMAAAPTSTNGAEIVRLSAENRLAHAPNGKEADAIHGDYVLRNDRVVAVVANPIDRRDANMSTRNVGGSLIDFTRRERPADQLTVLYTVPQPFQLRRAEVVKAGGEQVVLACRGSGPGGLEAEVRYTLGDGWDWILVETTYTNPTEKSVPLDPVDLMRADRTFTFGVYADGTMAWAYDKWFRQAYGVVPVEGAIRGEQLKSWMGPKVLRYAEKKPLRPGKSLRIARRVICAEHGLGLRTAWNRIRGIQQVGVELAVVDPDGPVAGADVEILSRGRSYAAGRSDERGRVAFAVPPGPYEIRTRALGRPSDTVRIEIDKTLRREIRLSALGYVSARLTDGQGRPIACKVQFFGREGTADPEFGPDSAARAVRNVYYSHDGRFRLGLGPGKYEVIVSHGPEYDASFQQIEIRRGHTTRAKARLRRSVQTPGWISAEFHSHSSPSGDNTSEQLGRVLNLLSEHIEFAPCTEHNRLDSYTPHLQALGAVGRMATCVGMELTDTTNGSINHQNAFPLRLKLGEQDGGGPRTTTDPLAQISRLALWDDDSEKLVQQNHPNMLQLLFDGNLDGRRDEAHGKMLAYMDAIEVHPLAAILSGPKVSKGRNTGKNRIHTWLLALNQGIRLPGVANTDAHYNFHGSGGLRNYIRSETDDPSEIRPLGVVRQVEAGHVVMTTGPFLEVSLVPEVTREDVRALPGDQVQVPQGDAKLHVRVQCPNWFDINRVQVLLNGKADSRMNYTRKTHPKMFADGNVKFDRRFDIKFVKDAHLIVVAVGEGLPLGRVMGPAWGKRPPIAVSNPIYVDVDGGGFKANGDTLGGPFPK